MGSHSKIGDQVIIALRRVIRAVDLHSRTLAESHGLTGPQALILKGLQNGSLSTGAPACPDSYRRGARKSMMSPRFNTG